MNDAQRERLDWLLCERLDRALTADEAEELARAFARIPDAASRAQAFEKLAQTLRAWRQGLPAIDWDAQRGCIRAGADELDEIAISESLDLRIDPTIGDPATAAPPLDSTLPLRAEYERTEQIVREWGQKLPPVDWAKLHSRIAAAVAREPEIHVTPQAPAAPRLRLSRAGFNWPWVANVAVPIAAAAAIALYFFWPDNVPGPRPSESGAAAGTIVVALDAPMAGGRVIVSFDPGQVGAMPVSESASSASEVSRAGAERAGNAGGLVIATAAPEEVTPELFEEAFYY